MKIQATYNGRVHENNASTFIYVKQHSDGAITILSSWDKYHITCPTFADESQYRDFLKSELFRLERPQ